MGGHAEDRSLQEVGDRSQRGKLLDARLSRSCAFSVRDLEATPIPTAVVPDGQRFDELN